MGPLAWLLVALLSTTLALLLYTAALSSANSSNARRTTTTQIFMGRFFITIAMYYTLWLTIAFFKRRRCVPNTILSGCLFRIAAVSVRFFTRRRWHSRSPVAVYLLATALIVPLFQTLVAGKATFVNP